MGKIDTIIDESNEITIHKTRQTIGIDDFKKKLKEYYSGIVTRFIVWDFSDASIDKSIATDDVRDLLIYARQFSRPGGKTALIAPRSGDFGMARMIETNINLERMDIELMVFKDYEEAEAWLGIRMSSVNAMAT